MDAKVEGDVIVCRQRDWTLETADAWMTMCTQLRAQHGRAFAILDTSQGINVNAQARRRIGEGFRERKLELFVVVGASLPTRTLFTLVSRAIAILRNRPASIRFAATMDEAHALINAARSCPM